MRAARYYGPKDIRVDEIPEPEPQQGQVKVKIAWNGICGSDLHAYIKPMDRYPKDNVPNPITGESAPLTLGHEFSGTIVSLGSGVDGKKWSVGRNVIIEPIFSCMKTESCYECSRNVHILCPKSNFIGIGGWGGGLAEYIAVDVRFLHILPENVPLEVGACIEPLSVAWYAVKRSGFKPGQSALVTGAGPIGLFLVKVLRSYSETSQIFVSEPAKLRREFALQHGASIALDPSDAKTSALQEILKATGGGGADVVFDAAGVQKSWDLAIHAVKGRGTIVNVAVWETPAQIDLNHVQSKEVIVTGTMAYDGVHSEVLEAVAAGKIPNIEKLITRKIALEDVVEQGFETLLNDRDSQAKILVHPGSRSSNP